MKLMIYKMILVVLRDFRGFGGMGGSVIEYVTYFININKYNVKDHRVGQIIKSVSAPSPHHSLIYCTLLQHAQPTNAQLDSKERQIQLALQALDQRHHAAEVRGLDAVVGEARAGGGEDAAADVGEPAHRGGAVYVVHRRELVVGVRVIGAGKG